MEIRNRLSFTAISKEIPIEDKNIKFLLDKIADVENIFGNNCYIIIGCDQKSPINDLTPEEQEKLLDWIEENIHSPFLFNYYTS
ncbi:MAG: hypothetical protein ACM3VV_03295 [Deltaproteobacteria bacterium]|jgi:hypothetical protein|nr:hypothetical protein [Nitrososphaeraceae archaeon]